MTLVQLIVTGDLERLALARSLKQAFPGVALEFLPMQKVSEFTSSRLGKHPGGGAKVRATELASAIVAALEPGRRGHQKPDVVLAIDDLELVNADQPATVTSYLAEEIRLVIQRRQLNQGTEARLRTELQARASFHLFNPLAEAYFFGEPASIARAGGDPALNRYDQTRDIEDFEVDDASYREWLGETRIVTPHRHPKHYVRYLVDPKTPGSRAYRETHEGVRAFGELSWSDVTAPTTQSSFARALFEDLADALGTTWPGNGSLAPETRRRSGGVLRNIG